MKTIEKRINSMMIITIILIIIMMMIMNTTTTTNCSVIRQNVAFTSVSNGVRDVVQCVHWLNSTKPSQALTVRLNVHCTCRHTHSISTMIITKAIVNCWFNGCALKTMM